MVSLLVSLYLVSLLFIHFYRNSCGYLFINLVTYLLVMQFFFYSCFDCSNNNFRILLPFEEYLRSLNIFLDENHISATENSKYCGNISYENTDPQKPLSKDSSSQSKEIYRSKIDPVLPGEFALFSKITHNFL